MKYFKIIGTAALVFAFGVVVAPTQAAAATDCGFSRDLEMGVDGEDVRCLQRYLNGAGFVVANSGVGSPGNETSLFRTLTEEAVIKWQQANGLPATGYFGPQSRSTYNKLMSNGAATTGYTNSGGQSLGGLDPDEVQDFLDLLNGTGSNANSSSNKPSATEREASQRLERAIEALQDEDDFEDDDVRDGIQTLLSAFLEYLDGNYSEARAEAELAYDKINEKEVDRDSLEDDIADAKDALDDAKDEVDDADDDDKDVDDAEDLLDEAEEAIENAEDAYDDEDWSEAREYVNEAKELIEDALDEIGIDREQEAEDAIDDAKDAIEEARDAIDEADDNDEDTDSAESLLDAAEAKLDDAEDAYDDEKWEDAIDDAKDAEDLANDAVDEL